MATVRVMWIGENVETAFKVGADGVERDPVLVRLW
jgi:hypothetical protein